MAVRRRVDGADRRATLRLQRDCCLCLDGDAPIEHGCNCGGVERDPAGNRGPAQPDHRGGGDLEAQPSAAGPPTSAAGLAASFELGLDRQATTAAVVGLTWPAQSVPASTTTSCCAALEPGLPDEVAVASSLIRPQRPSRRTSPRPWRTAPRRCPSGPG